MQSNNIDTKINPIIEWKIISDEPCLYFIFTGTLTENDAVLAIGKWKKLISEKNHPKLKLVYNCLEMDGYDKRARVIWQNTILELKDQIDEIWVIAKSNLIKIGASVMGTFTKFKIRVVESEQDIKF